MFKTTTNDGIEKLYLKLKEALLEDNCKIIIEQPPTFISVRQGSLSGITPKTAKKKISYHLTATQSGTNITAMTSISSDWTNLTLYGNILAGIMAAVFLWIAADIENYIIGFKIGYWTWLAQIYSASNAAYAMLIANVIKALGIFLIVAIAAEILIVIYVYPRKNIYAQQTLQTVLNSKK